MLEINCDNCGKEINEPGALVFSPPDENRNVKKYHICIKCWQDWYVIYNALKESERVNNERTIKYIIE